MAIISAVQGIREEIATRLNEAESDNTDIYTNWINLCLRDVANSFPKAPFLWASADRTLSSGTRQYNNLPSDFDKMNDVVIPSTSLKLSYLTNDEFDALQPSASQGGNPGVYTIRGQGNGNPLIEFYWVPGSSLTVHYDYQKNMDVVSAGSATPSIPVKYFELPILYGEKFGLRRKGRYEESGLVDQQYQQLKEMMIQDLVRITNENVRIKSVREFQRGTQIYDDPIRNIFHGVTGQ